MKYIINLAAALVLGCTAASAQYMPTTEGKTFVTTQKITEGNVESDINGTVISVQTAADGVLTARVEEKETIPGDLFSGEMSTFSTYSYNPADKVTTYTMMTADDFKAFIVDMLVQAASASGHTPTEQDLIELNKAMKVRGELSMPLPDEPEMDATFDKSILRCTMGTQNMTITISKGVYKGFEEIETPAGKFNCLKVEYATKRAMGGPVENLLSTTWFAKGVGVVKTVDTDKKGKVISEQTLKSLAE